MREVGPRAKRNHMFSYIEEHYGIDSVEIKETAEDFIKFFTTDKSITVFCDIYGKCTEKFRMRRGFKNNDIAVDEKEPVLEEPHSKVVDKKESILEELHSKNDLEPQEEKSSKRGRKKKTPLKEDSSSDTFIPKKEEQVLHEEESHALKGSSKRGRKKKSSVKEDLKAEISSSEENCSDRVPEESFPEESFSLKNPRKYKPLPAGFKVTMRDVTYEVIEDQGNCLKVLSPSSGSMIIARSDCRDKSLYED